MFVEQYVTATLRGIQSVQTLQLTVLNCSAVVAAPMKTRNRPLSLPRSMG